MGVYRTNFIYHKGAFPWQRCFFSAQTEGPDKEPIMRQKTKGKENRWDPASGKTTLRVSPAGLASGWSASAETSR